jgi:hypothetical protein
MKTFVTWSCSLLGVDRMLTSRRLWRSEQVAGMKEVRRLVGEPLGK